MESLDLTKHYTVVGLGSTGRSVVRFLRARGVALNAVDSTDWEGRSAALDDEFPGLKFDLGEPDVACLNGTDVLVMSPFNIPIPLNLKIFLYPRKSKPSLRGQRIIQNNFLGRLPI